MAKIHFGTDGWRAVISEDFTFENVKIVAQAIADYIKNQKSKISAKSGSASAGGRSACGGKGGKNQKSELYGKKFAAIVGYDTRFLSEKYAELVACVLAANGIKVVLTDRPTPTPSVSFNIRRRNFIGGVMITASHNPARYNGIKYKMYFGGSANTEVTSDLESRLYKSKVKFINKKEAEKNLLSIENIIPTHIKFIKKYVDMKLLKKSSLNILVDSMHGTGSNYIEQVLKNTNNKVLTISGTRDPYFGGRSPEPNEVHLRDTSKIMKGSRYDLCLATDGDADRLGVILPNGEILSGHKVMTLLLLHLLEDRGLSGGVVQTICGTALINKICKFYELKSYETAVGFKYIADIFNREDVLIGGEETGGVAFKGWLPERDSILSGLLILEMSAFRKKSLIKIIEEINKQYGFYVYKRYDMRFPQAKKKKLLSILGKKTFNEVLGKKIVDIKSYDGFKFVRDDGSWFMLRPSGTEPKLRIYSEASSEKEALRLIEFGKNVALRV